MLKINLHKLIGRKGSEFNAPWEQAFDRVLTPFEEFIHRQTTSGVLLLGCAVVALVMANSPMAEAYGKLFHTYFSVGLGSWAISMSLHHWINDGLMAFFFFHVGLELKREFLVGELADPRQAALPAIAAIGGMVVPAAFYYLFNQDGPGIDGWGIPMATDIAFAVGVISLLGARVPKGLLAFLVALAIVDDLGAIMVIAIFYTNEINLWSLFVAADIALLLFMANFFGIRNPVPYLLLGTGLWLALYFSGVHATLAGVISAFAIPAKPKYDPVAFSAQVKNLIRRFDGAYRPGEDIYRNDRIRSYVMALDDGVRLVQPPLQVIERKLHLPVTYIVIPLFALANAGIPLSVFDVGPEGFSSITIGVIAGLVLGKSVGITGAVWLASKMGLGPLPAGCHIGQILGVSLLAGIGFTMSIFISELAFADSASNLLNAKAGVLAGSIVAGILGAALLYWFGNRTNEPGEVTK